MTSADAVSTCPITQEPIRTALSLRNAQFELDAILEMIRQDAADAKHPYERTRFTADEFRHIHETATLHCPNYLQEAGWVQLDEFMKHLRQNASSPLGGTTSTHVEVLVHEPIIRRFFVIGHVRNTEISCTVYEVCVCSAMMLVSFAIMMIIISGENTL